jgi:hypothetical protein
MADLPLPGPTELNAAPAIPYSADPSDFPVPPGAPTEPFEVVPADTAATGDHTVGEDL